MTERTTDKRTIVGVPFYDGEGHDVLSACLKNIDNCLNNLGVDAKIVVGINGPRVSLGQAPLSYQINRSEYNADIKFIKTPPGLVNAEKTIARRAMEEGYKRIFLTDADISRLPMAFYNMWNSGNRPVVGANYSAYPLEILACSGIHLTLQEIAFMRIFEADKHPLARKFTYQYRPVKRLKGSLLLVDVDIIKTMFGYQSITSDSRMNRILSDSDRQIVPNAAFMHFARVDITDHIQARIRHFRAAEALNDLDAFTRRSLIYEPRIADEIAGKIMQKYPQATRVASDFLLQCALRYKVAEICYTIASGKKYNPKVCNISYDDIDMTTNVHCFQEAAERIMVFLSQVDWSSLSLPVTNGKGTTQSGQSRTPIDLEPFLETDKHKKVILEHLGLDENAKI